MVRSVLAGGDGKKAAEAKYSKLQSENDDLYRKSGITLKELVVTPLQITIPFHAKTELKEQVHYRKMSLEIGGRMIEGTYNFRQKNGEYDTKQPMFSFESPEWYADWSRQPMKSHLSQAEVTRRDLTLNWTDYLRLDERKQQAVLKTQEGFKIVFTILLLNRSPLPADLSGSARLH